MTHSLQMSHLLAIKIRDRLRIQAFKLQNKIPLYKHREYRLCRSDHSLQWAFSVLHAYFDHVMRWHDIFCSYVSL